MDISWLDKIEKLLHQKKITQLPVALFALFFFIDFEVVLSLLRLAPLIFTLIIFCLLLSLFACSVFSNLLVDLIQAV